MADLIPSKIEDLPNGTLNASAFIIISRDGTTEKVTVSDFNGLFSGGKGDTGADGLSAYQVYVKNVAVGSTPLTESKWLESLKGLDGSTPTIGFNNHWFINGVDTGISALGIQGVQGIQGIRGEKGEKGDTGVTPSQVTAITNHMADTVVHLTQAEHTKLTNLPTTSLAYENGTWTPNLLFRYSDINNGYTTVTYTPVGYVKSATTARYSKVGKLISVMCDMYISNIGTLLGGRYSELSVGGFPYAIVQLGNSALEFSIEVDTDSLELRVSQTKLNSISSNAKVTKVVAVVSANTISFRAHYTSGTVSGYCDLASILEDGLSLSIKFGVVYETY